jgi:2-keto-4-pentenoate hydratase/2-oxohepta-3-ene-1,7-dioic acid hydratase in catechol pathway
MTTPIARIQLAERSLYVELEGSGGHVLDAAPWRSGRRTGERIETIEGLRRLCPVEPSKIVCIGRNYRAHAAELGNEVPAEPLLFFKPPSSLLGPGGVVELPPTSLSERVEHEVELGIVVGAPLRRAGEDEARRAIWGHTIVVDVTARDLQRRDGQWTRAKGFDTFCPVGPVVVQGLDAVDLAIRCRVSGELRQDGRTSMMVFEPPALLAYISQVMRLEPGDLIATGTPAGVGPLRDGDVLVASIEGVGELEVTVRAS